MWETFALVLLLSLSCSLSASAQQDCLMASNGERPLPNFVRPGGGGEPRFEVNPIQAIITSYRFNCCGVITEWRAFVEGSGGGHFADQPYTINFQVWRPNSPSPVDSDGCYNMVGMDNFSSIPLADNGSPDRGIVTGTVPEGEEIEVQPGDVVGFYLESSRRNVDDGIQFAGDGDNDPDYTSETVWYAAGTIGSTGTPECPLNVGTGRALTMSSNRAPLISVSVAVKECPQPTTMAPITSATFPPNPPLPQSTTDPLSTDEDSTTIAQSPASTPSSPTGLVVGFVLALLVVIVIAVLTVVLVVVLMRRRQNKNGGKMSSTRAWSNPSYEDTTTSVNGQGSKSSKKKLPARPLTINTSGDGSVYETFEDGYHGIPEALDYTLPTPSPTAKYDPKKNDIGFMKRRDEPAYHVQGPDVGNQYDYCGPSSPYDDLEPNYRGKLDSSVQYEDPTLPKFRINTFSKDPFESQGTYVPTLAQRQAMSTHYELQDDPNVQTYDKLQFFVEDQIYWAPAGTASDLYQQLASKKYREIPRNQIMILEQLGSGQFGQVCKGLWSISDNSLQLAVKTLKPNVPETDKVKFLQEAAIMGQFLHPNVVKLYGVVTVGEPVMICLEIMSSGDLRSYLRGIDMSSTSKIASQDLQLLFLRFAKEIAAGMDYLSKKAFVHRDLAARNVLVNDDLTCKIGDFGMARDLMDDTYYTSRGGKIPVKWTAPEALLYKKYSTDSDVWSYGMVLFEVWSVGQKPFSMHTNNEVLRLIQSGYVQCPPPGCPREMYRLMVDCWNPEHQYRPKFGVICSRLQAPTTKLLYWSPQDSSVSEKVSVLGAPLEEGYNLHEDLREKYKQYE